MVRVETSVMVDADPEAVWAFVNDATRYHEWVTFTDEMRHVDDGEPRVGFRYTEYGGVGPMKSESDWEIVEYEPPTRQTHVGDLGIMKPRLTIVVEPSGGGTRWTQTIEFEALPRLRPVGRLLERLFIRRSMVRGLTETLANGKAMVERETSESTPEPTTG